MPTIAETEAIQASIAACPDCQEVAALEKKLAEKVRLVEPRCEDSHDR